jgi:hypothetical protein
LVVPNLVRETRIAPENLFAIAPVENCARRDLDKVVDD